MTEKKKAPELVSKDLARRLFPKEVREAVKKEVAESKPRKSAKKK